MCFFPLVYQDLLFFFLSYVPLAFHSFDFCVFLSSECEQYIPCFVYTSKRCSNPGLTYHSHLSFLFVQHHHPLSRGCFSFLFVPVMCCWLIGWTDYYPPSRTDYARADDANSQLKLFRAVRTRSSQHSFYIHHIFTRCFLYLNPI